MGDGVAVAIGACERLLGGSEGCPVGAAVNAWKGSIEPCTGRAGTDGGRASGRGDPS
jgi:hypothetical protein